MDIFFSNGYYGNKPLQSSVTELLNAGCDNIEVSCGETNREDLNFLKRLKGSGKKIRIHNYFPNLNSDFVMNLASFDKEILAQTKDLIFTSLRWSHELDSNYYAFHCGFLFDPKPDELGGNFSVKELSTYSASKDAFREELHLVKCYADKLGIEIAVENNVYDNSNYDKFGENIPLLAVSEDNIEDILIDGVGLLLDFGHLKVSAATTNKDRDKLCRRWLPHTTGFHLSDNNGLRDQNNMFDESAWFLKYLGRELKPTTVEVYTSNPNSLLALGRFIEKGVESKQWMT